MALFHTDTIQQAHERLVDFPANWERLPHGYLPTNSAELWQTRDGFVFARICKQGRDWYTLHLDLTPKGVAADLD